MSRIEFFDGFSERNHRNPDHTVYFNESGVCMIDQNLKTEASSLLAVERKYAGLNKNDYWKLRQSTITKLTQERAEKRIQFEDFIEESYSLFGLFTLAIVNGECIRKFFDDQFIQGGHPNQYKYLPSRTIVAEKALDSREYPAVFLHEGLEYLLMTILPYDPSHAIADTVERLARKVLLNFFWRETDNHYPGRVKGN